MASPTQWTWVWVNSGSRWWTGRPGVLQSMGSRRVRHYWATELNWGREVTGSVSLLCASLTGWWGGSRLVSQGLTLSVLKLQESRCHVLLIIEYLASSMYWSVHWRGGGLLYLQSNSGNVHQTLLSRYFRKVLKQRIWGKVPGGPAWLYFSIHWVLHSTIVFLMSKILVNSLSNVHGNL